MAKDVGRKVGVMTFSHVVCRPTEQEALGYIEYYAVKNVDQGGLNNLMDLQFAHAKSFPYDHLAKIRDSMAVGQCGYRLIRTPQQVPHGIPRLHEIGFNWTNLSFVDYVEEFPYFRYNVLPLLEKAETRHLVGNVV
jgi:FMNH2-dependent dimethyl sulfone monooxygenase